MESMPVPFAIFQMVDSHIVTLALSDGFCALLGAESRAQAYTGMDQDTYKNVHPDDVVRVGNAVYRFMKEGGRFETIYRLRKMDGTGYVVIHAYGEHIYGEGGVRLAQVWYADEGDYTEASAGRGLELSQSLSNALHEESILKANYYDYLTGLPSMTYFFELAEEGKALIQASGDNAAFLYADLSGMKFFNQKHGFAEGDRLLRAFARVFSQTFGNENCSHLGQDHFAAYAPEEGLEDRLHRLFRECREANGGNTLPVLAGIYSTRLGDVPVSTACDRAKIACDALKGAYGSGYNYYSRALKEEAEKKQHILENLDRAIAEGWIQVYYQPIVRAVTERVCDEEALSRWVDPVKGFLSPADFIPVLEDAGLIYKLDLYVLEQVLEKINAQKASGFHIVPHSVNLSRSDFDTCDIVEEIRRRVDAAGVPRDRITIEITESIIGGDFDFMKTQVERFQALGFPVWMDDFGSGYSSLDVLQSIKFNLLKFDMGFMRKLDEGDSGKIILTELMKMATSLGVDTICEGVETIDQVRFLQEIGCSKLQGYYFSKPIPLAQILERYEKGEQIGYENPDESAYFEAIGRVNLYDLGVIANEDQNAFHNFFNTLPMGIVEINDGQVRFVRTNQSYRDFMNRFFHFEPEGQPDAYPLSPFGPGSAFMKLVQDCCKNGGRAFFDEQMSDGSTVHAFARRISVNPVTGTAAAAIAVLSISDPDEGQSYADIARALAADYYNIYVVDLDTDRFIEYTSPVGGEEMAVERHGEHFFDLARRDNVKRIYAEDREMFLSVFTRENILRELDSQEVFRASYRIIDTGTPLYAGMKITRMHAEGNRIIMGISIIDAQIKHQQEEEKVRRQNLLFGRIAALSGRYYAMYLVDPDTGLYSEYSVTTNYNDLGFDKRGENFFIKGRSDGEKAVHPEDMSYFLRTFTRENFMRGVRNGGIFKMHYRLVVNGVARPIALRAAMVSEPDGEKLIVGVNVLDEKGV